MIVPGAAYIQFSPIPDSPTGGVSFLSLPGGTNTLAGISSDGITFTPVTAPTLTSGFFWHSAIHNGSVFCILAYDGDVSFYTATSTDGETWSYGSVYELTGLIPSGTPIIGWTGSLFYLCITPLASTDGLSWS